MIKETIERSCVLGGVLNKELAEEKLHDLSCLLGKASELEADATIDLAKQRIVLIDSDTRFKFKSGRELDRELDERCPALYKKYIEAKELHENLKRAIQAQITLVSSLNK